MRPFILTLILCSVFLVGNAMAGDLVGSKDSGINCPKPEMYFDSRTGHKYIKQDDNCYKEYSKRGEYLKTVRADLPLLVNSKNVHPVSKNCYLLYQKAGCSKDEFVVLPSTASHPDGCRLMRLLVALE